MNIKKADLKDLQMLMDIYEKSDDQRLPFNRYPFMEWIIQESRLVLMAHTKQSGLGFIVVREKDDDIARIDFFIANKHTKPLEVKRAMAEKALQMVKARRLECYLEKDDPLVKVLKSAGFERVDEFKDMFGENKDGLLIAMWKGGSKPIPTRLLRKDKILRENLSKLEEIKETPEEENEHLSDF